MSAPDIQTQLYSTQGWTPSNTGLTLPAAKFPPQPHYIAAIGAASATQILTTNMLPAAVEHEFDAQVMLVVSAKKSVHDAMAAVDAVVSSQG